MNRPDGNRARICRLLIAAVTAVAMLALPGAAAAHHGSHDAAADAGTVESFDPATGVLVVDLTAGGSISGLVVERTQIRCGEDKGRHHGRHGLRHHLRDHGASASRRDSTEGEDDHQVGEQEPGDDHGTRGLEPGEDDHQAGEDAPGRSENPGRGAERSAHCTADDLVAGATVKAAELVLFDGKALYKEVELARSAEPETVAPPSS